MRGSAVDERRAGRVERARVADGGAFPRSFPARERGVDIVVLPRRYAQHCDVDGQPLADLGRRLARAREGVGHLFRNRQFQCALVTNQMVSNPNTIIAAAITANTPCSETASEPTMITR